MSSPPDRAKNSNSLYEPESMVDVRSKYSQLQTVLGSFNEKVSDVLSKAEVQYLQAYRTHMQSVHAEKLDLEAKLRQAEAQQANDQQMRNLEKDVEWYRRQKQQLEAAAVAMQKDLLYMQERFDVLSRERDELSVHVKSIKKLERVSAVEAKAAARQKQRLAEAKEAEHEEHRRRLQRARAAAASASSLSHRAGQSLPSFPGDHFEEEGSTPTELRRRLRVEKEQLLRDRAEVQRLRQLVVCDRSVRSELEEFFLQAVEDLRKETERKTRHQETSGSCVLTSEDREMEVDLTLLFDCLFPQQNGPGKKK